MHLCYQYKVRELRTKINPEKDITRYSHDRVNVGALNLTTLPLNNGLLIKTNRPKIKSMGLRIEVLIRKIKNKNCLPMVVGIDLSGSAERNSGFCVLDGEKAFLDLVKTDEEIILKTIKAVPAVISIDSPQLTSRGIKLARYFRKMGYEVIESYPGAAQDILGIPRKRVDLPELETDLRGMGIKPCVKSKAITHDEIDALVCALVGFFYLAESYEALGNEKEGYLILPAGIVTGMS